MSTIVASEEAVEDNYYGPSSCSLIVKFALLRSMSDMSLILVREPSTFTKPPKLEKLDIVPNNVFRRCMQQFGDRKIIYV
jgi:hypothetical protein